MDDEAALPAGKLRSVVTFLEMTEAPDLPPAMPPCSGATLERCVPEVGSYRPLYAAVGERWMWIERRKLDDAALAALLNDPAMEVHLLRLDGQPIGYYEIDRRVAGEIELVYCGVVPEHIGQGWGTFLLQSAIAQAWSLKPRRFWLHTCDFDHAGALAFYLRHGFREYDRIVEVFDDPRLTGLLPATAAPHVPLARSR